MSTQPFTPLGEKSRREMVLEMLAAADYDTTVKYSALEDALDADRATVQAAVHQAKPALERNHRKAVVAVKNVGYRIVNPSEHHGLAVVHQKKSVRQIRKSLSKVNYVDASQLTEGEKAAVTLAATSLALQLDYMRRNDIRAKRHDDMIKATQKRTERTEAEIAELKARLARIEGSKKDQP